MTMQTAIQLQGVTKHYGTQTALDQLSLIVPQGAIFALLGENGAGKTTAVRIVMGLTRPDCGTVTVLGLDPVRQSLTVRQQVGYVPERPTFYEWMTVDEIGWFTAGFYTAEFLKSYRQQAKAFGLPPQKRIRELSKGMRAKVSLSLALAKDPPLLVLDEPTSGLDTLVRREFLESMVDRAADGKTVFISSHQISEVERVADYIAIIKQGQLLVVDRLEKLKAEITEFTVTFAQSFFELPTIAGSLLSQRSRVRQWQVVVRSAQPDLLENLRRLPGVDSVEQRTPNLEEIYVALLTSDSGSTSDSAGTAGLNGIDISLRH